MEHQNYGQTKKLVTSWLIRDKYFNYEPTEEEENLIENRPKVELNDITDLFFL